jgi:hypothetical protein
MVYLCCEIYLNLCDIMNMLKKEKAGRKDAPRVIECLNLRPVEGSTGDVLTVVGAPAVIADEGWKPLGMAGDTLIIYKGLQLARAEGGKAVAIATLPSAPLCMHCSQRNITVMTEAGQYLLLRNDDGTFTDVGMMPQFGAIAVTAEFVDAYSATVEACSTSAITAAVCKAYREIVEGARLAGAFLQPVVARCKLLDGDGHVVHVTQPVAVMLQGGAPLVSAWQFGSDDGGETVRSEMVSANAYRLRVTVGESIPEAWRKIVRTLQVEVTPQFHPIDFGGSASVNLGRASSTEKFVRVTLPGVERGLSATRTIASEALLRRAVERFDSIAETVAYINNPYAGGVDVCLSVATPADVADEADNMAAALAKAAPERVSAALARVSLPHSFVADGVAAGGEAVVWANIKAKRFGGYGAMAYAAMHVAKHYSGYTAITFGSGERVVTAISGDYAPTSLCPLISYPSAEATAFELSIAIDGESGMRTLSVALTPDATGQCAMYVSPTLAPIAFEVGAVTTAPAAVAGEEAASGYVGVSGNAAVPQVKAVCSVGDNVTAVLAARSGSSAWEYRRARFYAFCNDGIKLLTTNAALSECAVNLLDRRSIVNRHCTADGGNAVYALCDSDLVRLSANSVKSIARNVCGDRVAWIAADNEVVVANTDDNEAVHYLLDSDADSYNSTLVVRDGWLAAAGSAYAEAEQGLVDLGSRSAAESTAVRWAACCEGSARERLPRVVQWPIKASQFAGTLSVMRRWLSGVSPTPQTVSRLTVNGAIRSPLAARLHGHSAVDLELRIAGTASRDARVAQPRLSEK